MASYKFDETLLTGDPQVDAQHRSLFDLVNQLEDAIAQNFGRESQSRVLQELTRYTLSHFSTEEALMRNNGYPNVEAHRRKHAELAEKVRRLLIEFQESYADLTPELSQFLDDWLRHHIQGEDKALVAWLRSNQ